MDDHGDEADRLHEDDLSQEDHHSHGDDHSHEDHHPHESDPDARVTSPMQSFRTQQALTGGGVLLVGLFVTFGLPLLLV